MRFRSPRLSAPRERNRMIIAGLVPPPTAAGRRDRTGSDTLCRFCRLAAEILVKLSILMPVYNEAERIADALKQALAVDYPCDIELVVVDDGSKDGTAEILAAS